MNNLPETATLHKVENGVEWYTEKDGVNTINRMVFNGSMLTGCWVGPQWVFRVLVEMTPDEIAKMATLSHDGCMYEIRMRIERMKGEV